MQRKKKAGIYWASPVCQALDQERDSGQVGGAEELCRWVWWVPWAFCSQQQRQWWSIFRSWALSLKGEQKILLMNLAYFTSAPSWIFSLFLCASFWHPSNMIPEWLDSPCQGRILWEIIHLRIGFIMNFPSFYSQLIELESLIKKIHLQNLTIPSSLRL